ncbi:MAG TPA: VTT domain-containing protein [Cytophagaceae bacterium]|jgi:membrane-associated protein|nr:VTT domain-containing protein [Cytophagaceae bacterium]
METIKSILDFFLHLDKYLGEFITNYGTWTYCIIFAIIFVETGLVIMPFLPGDSLLFAVGAFCASGSLNLFWSMILLFIAAFLGDTLNYFIGKTLGKGVLSEEYYLQKPGQNIFRTILLKFMKREHVLSAQAFYEKHGGKTIIIARFIPIIRTFAPFIAGISHMNYGRFISYNIIGGFVWVIGLTMLGFFFGNLEVVKKNFELVIFGIILISILPPIIQYLRHVLSKR